MAAALDEHIRLLGEAGLFTFVAAGTHRGASPPSPTPAWSREPTATFPVEVWRQAWSDTPAECFNKEIRRRTDSVGIFPNREAIIRLVDAQSRLAEEMGQAAALRFDNRQQA
ncbi:hypothetical protein HMPREF0975_01806 [Actinomyces sp. oral taxon 849 str. F0330]|nr:hypothetical protein HMPREF0975_01806 [Actinomyces sp. oral taxon 849 str. F0330]